jgi:hypothetical protein
MLDNKGYGYTRGKIAMIRSAFKPNPPGPLTDPSLPTAERQATMELFSGAFGVFRNPSGHREVEYGDPASLRPAHASSFLPAFGCGGRGPVATIANRSISCTTISS